MGWRAFWSWRSWLERLGRRWLLKLLIRLGGQPQAERPLPLGLKPRLLVVRLDERLGNAILLTPLLSSLRIRFPKGEISVVLQAANVPVLLGHPAIDKLVPFDKRAWGSRHGPVAWLVGALLGACARFVRRGEKRWTYDVCLDGANPTDPSLTQAVYTWTCGARYTVGPAASNLGPLYSVAVEAGDPRDKPQHEIDLRLALLQALPGEAVVRTPSVPPLAPLDLESAWGQFLSALPAQAALAVVQVGTRLAHKTLRARQYAELGRAVEAQGFVALFSGGHDAWALTEAAFVECASVKGQRVPPGGTVAELAQLFAQSHCVVCCDTGPMHLAVAVGTPTCGLFVATAKERYGYNEAPHRAVDVFGKPWSDVLQEVGTWSRGHLPPEADNFKYLQGLRTKSDRCE